MDDREVRQSTNQCDYRTVYYNPVIDDPTVFRVVSGFVVMDDWDGGLYVYKTPDDAIRSKWNNGQFINYTYIVGIY